MHYPKTPRVDAGDTLHGQYVSDPYRWLEDGKSPAVKSWVDSQDALTHAYVAQLPGREALVNRLAELRTLFAPTAPRIMGDRTFFVDLLPGGDKHAFWVKLDDGQSLTIFDPAVSPEHLVLRHAWPSPDGRRAAVVLSKNNQDASEIHVFAIEATGSTQLEVVPNTFDSNDMAVTWMPDSNGFFYRYAPTRPDVAPPDRSALNEIRFHSIGTSSDNDRIVRGPAGATNAWEHIEVSSDGRWLVLVRYVGAVHTDLLVQDTISAPGRWTSITDARDITFDVRIAGRTLFLRTEDGAANRRIMAVDLASPSRDRWREIVPEREDFVIEDFTVTQSRIVLRTSKDAIDHLETVAHDGSHRREISLPTLGSVESMYGSGNSDTITFAFSSYTVPQQLFALDVRTNSQRTIPRLTTATVDSSKFVIEQTFTTSKDGTRFPMFIARSRTATPMGNNPTLLSGYGAFGATQRPYFIPRVFAWLEQGGVFVMANTRGGSEYGEKWYRDALATKRQNVFDDFLSAATTLIDRKWASPATLAVYGGSAGGLLVAAAETQHPELFAAVLCEIPLTDMIRYPLFGTGKAWFGSFGNPWKADEFRALYAYSPYHHVRPGVRYPATLVVAHDSDDRLDPMHARKFTAALQSASINGPVLLRIEKGAGHSGSGSLRGRAEVDADMLLFARHQMSLP